MRNLAMGVMILIGIGNVDRIYYHGAMLKPVYGLIWQQICDLI